MRLLRTVEFAFLAFREIGAHLHWCFILRPSLVCTGAQFGHVGWGRSLWILLRALCCFASKHRLARCAPHTRAMAAMKRFPSSLICGMGCWNSSRCGEISPRLQRGLEDWEMCRLALTCHFALDVFCVVVNSR